LFAQVCRFNLADARAACRQSGPSTCGCGLLLCLQAARLLCSFREYHRRAQLGLASFYANKLAALEDGLLNAREVLFAAQEQDQEKQPQSQEQVRTYWPA
jgi:hypothetical protein